MCMSFLLFTINTHAQDPRRPQKLTLDEVWSLADSNSKRIQIQQVAVSTTEAGIKAARAERLPELEAGGVLAHIFPLPIFENGLFHTPTQFPVEPKYYKVAADAYLNLSNGGKTEREIKASKKENEIALAKMSLSKQEIHYAAALYFYDVYRNLSYKSLLLQDVKDLEQQLKEINHLYKNGTVLKSDVLRAELRLSRQKMMLTEIQNNQLIASQKLNLLIGAGDDDSLIPEVKDSLNDALVLKQMDQYLSEADVHSYQLDISKKESELQELKLKQLRSNVMPSLGLFAEYAYAYPQIQFYPYSLAPYGNGMAGLKLKIPIAAFYKNKHQVAMQQLRVHQSELADEEERDNIRQEVKTTYIKYRESLQRIDVATENIRQASESYRIVQNTYFNQLSLLTDLLDAETQLLQSRFELTTAKVNARIQYYQLQKAVGTL